MLAAVFLGSNIDPHLNLSRAKQALCRHPDLRVEGSSEVYETLLTDNRGDLSQLLRHVRVERYYISKRYRVGAVTVGPQLHVDAKEVQLTEDERRISMSTYIAVIYISFAVFIVTIWILGVTFLPKMQEAAAEINTGDSGLAVDSPLPQNVPEIIFNVQVAFFIAVIVHAVGDGVLAGILDSGKIVNGLRHSFIMLLIAVVGFQLL